MSAEPIFSGCNKDSLFGRQQVLSEKYRTQTLLLFSSSPDESVMNFTTEGCFCPDGMKLFNKESGVCVDKCGKAGVFFLISDLITQHPL